MISYDLKKIQFDKPQHIFISSKVKVGAYNKKAYGFLWKSGDNDLFFTNREDKIYEGKELELIALSQLIDMLENTQLELIQYQIYIEIFSNHLSEFTNHKQHIDIFIHKLLTRCQVSIQFLNRLGIEIKFSKVDIIPQQFEKKLSDAINGYIIQNDFQSDTLFLSAVSSRTFDKSLFGIVNTSLIEYVSTYERGIPGIQKRLITPDDESSVNSLLLNFHDQRYRNEDNFLLDFYRRTLMTIRDADLIIASVNILDNGNLIFPDSLFQYAADAFNVPIFIFDAGTFIWYNKSITERRELVKTKKLPTLNLYKNVTFYINVLDINTIWSAIKKLIKE